MSKGQNAQVTEQDKLDRSVISKDRPGNRKLKVEMVYRSRLKYSCGTVALIVFLAAIGYSGVTVV